MTRLPESGELGTDEVRDHFGGSGETSFLLITIGEENSSLICSSSQAVEDLVMIQVRDSKSCVYSSMTVSCQALLLVLPTVSSLIQIQLDHLENLHLSLIHI